MTTATVDDRKRVRIGAAKPGQVFSVELSQDGSVVLTPVKAERKEMFPRGSLLKYITPERNKELLEIQAGCSLEVRE